MTFDPSKPFHYKEGIVKTHLHCHSCRSGFVAFLNYDVDGNHRIVCPRCGHIHYRVIDKGIVTSDRYDSDMRDKDEVEVPTESFWRSDTMEGNTSTAAKYINDKWKERLRK